MTAPTKLLMLLVVILAIALMFAGAHHTNTPIPSFAPINAPAYVPPGTPGPYELYRECLKVGFAPIRCENTYLR